MSKRHHREEDTLERLEKENRKLKSTVRSLLKQLKKINRGYNKLRDDDVIEEKDIPQDIKKMCFECGAEYKLITVHNRRFRKCQGCGKTGKVTII